MRDRISVSRIQTLHPLVRDDARNMIEDAENELGITLRVTMALRTIEEQDGLYSQGRTKPGKKVTNAKGGQSFHNYGCAFDIVQMVDGVPNWNFDYTKLLPYAKKYGFAWGGNFKSIPDKPHFEKTFGLGWREMLARHKAGKFIPGTKYITIDV